ncbi:MULTISPECIES: pirin family protein [unclassified Wenzhouxiangella]|uniref:pirin family protein n=1 Tax=unclassified Wenzhouxiangella TaxID=2613841 RepID=UPI000E32C66B|nr:MULTISPECIES: pirin family protein [unclassified Wenzhouxiangella]RFF27381.1 pirin family protein [Wenzhouxiangella sp. 15181]RFP68809.1 pirin family protein [Wenzhouxiangella sp. 15190]
MTTTRTLERIIESLPTSDGAGVKLRRSLGQQANDDVRLDPFLMLDEFYSDNPDDYLAGFPPHPHRGFETVTYMLEGRMQHRDHLGNTGDLGPGGVQWMTAGRGVIHSEMPQQSEGRMRGFQLWINLPAAEKMKPADYRDIPSDAIPTIELPAGAVRVIAGRLALDGRTIAGPVNGEDGRMATDPLYLDVHLEPSTEIELPVTPGHSAFAYLYDGAAEIAGRSLPHRAAGILGDGERVRIAAGDKGARLLLLAARPLGEPVAQYGPFVMNTREEIERAVEEYREGRLTEA